MVPGTLKALLNGLSILAWLLSRVSVRDRLVDRDRTLKPKKKSQYVVSNTMFVSDGREKATWFGLFIGLIHLYRFS